MPIDARSLSRHVWIFLVLLSAVVAALTGESKVTVREESIVVPTYPVGPAEPNPVFYNGRAYQGAKGPVYPYPLLDRLSDVKQDKTYKAVYLENEFVRICVLPEIGGRIFEAVDKTNGYNFIYRQHVIKPALIGMLGAWISGGAEWNIPHHHRATSFMEVDSAWAENPDGSATVWVGETELRHRTKWVVGLTLRPRSSCLEVTIRLSNRTPLAHSLLCWANVAVHANEDYQILFPPGTEYATFHGKNQFSRWPLSTEIYNNQDYTGGVDVSWWKNHVSPTSFFAWNSEEDFFGGYDHGKEAGIVFIADHNTVPGKKLWTWGTGSEGKRWEKILTDADGPYLELMVGAFSDNQPDYSWSQPYEVKTVKQYWYPVRGLGGLKNANRDAACNLEIGQDGGVWVSFHSTSECKGARVLLKAGERILHDEVIDTGPSLPYKKWITVASDINKKALSLSLLDKEGREIVGFTPVEKRGTPMPSPVTPPPPPDKIKSVDELYLTGLRLEQIYNPAYEPYPYYEEALRRDPDDARVNTALGILFLKRGMYRAAEEALATAVTRLAAAYTRPKDGEASYYLGLALRAQGKEGAALAAFEKSAWSAAWRAAAHLQLAEISAKKGAYLKALDHLEQSLAMNILNTKALNLKASLLRRLGRHEEALECAAKVLAGDPLDFWARNEVILALKSLGKESEAASQSGKLGAVMRNSPAAYLELAVDYGTGGLWEESIEVLRGSISGRSPGDHPLIYYALGYFFDKADMRDEALKSIRKAEALPPDHAFPFQLDFIDILTWAQAANPQDARAPYYLGNLLYDLQPEKAIEEWKKSVVLDGSFSTAQRNLGLGYARVMNDIPRAVTCLEKAAAANKKDPRLFYELDVLYEAAGAPPEKRLSLFLKNHEVVVLHDDALAREIILLVQTGRFDRAISLLNSHHFHIWEGGGEIHTIWVDAHLLRGQEKYSKKLFREALSEFRAALEYPDNLEVGVPAHGPGSSKVFYLIGTAEEALGNKAEAASFYERSAGFPSGWSEQSYYQGLALKKSEKGAEAMAKFEGLVQFAREGLTTAPSMDFFEKFGERQSAGLRSAHLHYLLGLGYLGRGEKPQAIEEFRKALELNPNHIEARREILILQ